ncbi:hypothetical protein [Peribacillus frigoritolerans]
MTAASFILQENSKKSGFACSFFYSKKVPVEFGNQLAFRYCLPSLSKASI